MSLDVQDIKTLTVKPDQVLVVRLDEAATLESVLEIRDLFQEALPGVRVAVLSPGISLEVVGQEPAA